MKDRPSDEVFICGPVELVHKTAPWNHFASPLVRKTVWKLCASSPGSEKMEKGKGAVK